MSANGKDFNFGIANFDDHIEHSIPSYTNLIQTSVGYLKYFINADKILPASIDLGCTTGKFSMLLRDCTKRDDCFGYDVELQGDAATTGGFFNKDIVNEIICPANTYTSFFTLQFLHRRDRTKVIEKIYNSLPVGGAFIIAEKVIFEDSYLQSITQEIHAGVKTLFFLCQHES